MALTHRDISPFVEWDSINWSKAVNFWQDYGHSLSDKRVLEIGAGSGRLSTWLAIQGARVWCTDTYMPTPETRDRHREAGVSERIEYGALNVIDIAFEDEFDAIVMKSVLPTLSTRHQSLALAGVHRALKPGGQLLLAENLQASRVHMFARQRMTTYGSACNYLTVQTLMHDLANFASVDLRTFGVLGTLGRSERVKRALGHLDTLAVERVAPKRWRYVAGVVATK